jgi:hypothetical protein
MKREAPSELRDSYSEVEERPAKVRRRESSSTTPGSLKWEQDQSKPQQPLSPFSPDFNSRVSYDGCFTTVISLTG